MRVGSRAASLAGILAVLALGVRTSRLAAAYPDAALGGGAPWESAVQVGAAVGATAAGLALILDRRVTACGVLLALTGPAILLAQLPAPDAGSALLFTAALAGGSLAPFLAGSAALACPVAPMRRVGWAIVALSLAVAGVIRGLLPAAAFDPRAAGCFSCASNLAEVHSDPALAAALEPWGLVLAIVLGAGLAAGAGWRLLRAPRIVALINAPLVLGGMAVSLLEVAAAAHTLQLPSYLESRYASSLLEDHPASSGYLLKERVYDSAVLADALQRVCAGECVIDPGIVSRLLGRNRERGPLDELTDREVEILGMMAEGHSNSSICSRLVISPRTVESHVRNVFMKLGIAESPDSSRRVLAVLAFLQA